jgi:hypothetical protein
VVSCARSLEVTKRCFVSSNNKSKRDIGRNIDYYTRERVRVFKTKISGEIINHYQENYPT